MNIKFVWLFSIIVIILFIGCEKSYDDIIKERESRVRLYQFKCIEVGPIEERLDSIKVLTGDSLKQCVGYEETHYTVKSLIVTYEYNNNTVQDTAYFSDTYYNVCHNILEYPISEIINKKIWVLDDSIVLSNYEYSRFMDFGETPKGTK